MNDSKPIRACGISAAYRQGEAVGWPHRHLLWRIDDIPSRLDPTGYATEIEKALSRWAAVCGMTFEETRGAANIVIGTENYDGRGGTLAMAQLPFPGIRDTSELHLWMDRGDYWILGDSDQGGATAFTPVACHEIGHIMGVYHTQTKHAPQSLMFPFKSDTAEPQESYDIPCVRALYGEPQPQDATPQEPTGGADELDKLIAEMDDIVGDL